MKRLPALWLDVAVKVSLLALLAFGAISGLDRFAGKGIWLAAGSRVSLVSDAG